MNFEHAAMRGRLAALEEKAASLRNRGRGLAGSVRSLVNEHLSPLEEMEVAQAAALMDQLVMAQGELLAALSEISRLRRELG